MALCVAWGRGEYGLEFKGFIDRLTEERENAHFWLNLKGMPSQRFFLFTVVGPCCISCSAESTIQEITVEIKNKRGKFTLYFFLSNNTQMFSRSSPAMKVRRQKTN
jgi:hypothetical protein